MILPSKLKIAPPLSLHIYLAKAYSSHSRCIRYTLNDALNHFSENDVTSLNSGTHLQKLAPEIRPDFAEFRRTPENSIAKKVDQVLKER